MDRREYMTRRVTDWAKHDPIHSQRLRDAAREGPEPLQRAVRNTLLLRGRYAGDDVKELSREITEDDFDRIDWHLVAENIKYPG